MEAVQQQKKYMWECPSCVSRYFSEPLTLGVRNGQLTRIPSICDKCFKSCSCGQRQPYGEYCQVCGDPRKRVNLIRYEIDPDDPTFGITSTGSATYPITTVGGTGDTDSEPAAYEIAQPVTMSVAGTIIKVTLKTVGNANVKLALFDDDAAGEPQTQLIDWGTFAITTGVNALTVTAYYVTAGNYYIAFLTDATSMRYLTASGSYLYKARAYASGIENPWPYASDSSATGTHYLQIGFVQIKGYAKLTKATLSEDTKSVTSMSFYSHATGNFRAAIYTDSSGPAVLKWESGSVAAIDDDWKPVDIADGTPNTLALDAGDYWLAWQWDSVNAGPSYTVGGANTGAYLAQAYGAFPDPMTGETLSTENWSLYVTYLQLALAGIVRDASGTPIEGATVWAFKTSDKSYVGTDTSDVNGEYSIIVGGTTVISYFIRAFKDGSPNVFGTTDDNLVGA